MAMTSTSQMITKLEGCLGTGDLSAWEENFVTNLVSLRDSGQVTKLSDKQVDTLEQLHKKHFA